MDKLLKMAASAADQAEIFYSSSVSDDLSFVDGNLKDADSNLTSGMALRVIKNGKIGLAHTRNLLDREALLKQALFSAENGMEVDFEFPKTEQVKELKTYSAAIEKTDKLQIVAEGKEIIEYIKRETDGQFNFSAGYSVSEGGGMNSSGSNLYEKSSNYYSYANLIFPGTASGLYKMVSGKEYLKMPIDKIDSMIKLFKLSTNEIVPQTAKMPVIFTTSTMYALLSRLFAASNPVNFYNKISPLMGKIDQKVFSDKLTVYQNPHNDSLSGASAFDYEGVPTQVYNLVENGIFKTIPTDLNYAAKLNLPRTGNGLRSIESMPYAGLMNVGIQTGNITQEAMIASIDKGIIVYELMGAHSGNVLNGDFSVGVSTGFYIEKGKIVGRVKDCMLAGNIYETFNNIIDIENSTDLLAGSMIPSVMFADMSVSGK